MGKHENYMKRALEIAAYAKARTAPNPMVGAVIVKDDEVIAEGWHHKAGMPHAEREALKIAGEAAKGAMLYVTLEPCSHYGRTPPCADAVIEAGIKEVYVAVLDPNPLVAGKGIAKLKAAGINVHVGLLECEAIKLNEVFFKWISKGLPFVVAKYAMTADGKIATKTGDSKWIAGEAARMAVHKMRDIYDAIMVGVGTVIADDPELTARFEEARNPVRIVLDSKCRIKPEATLLHDGKARTIVAVTELADNNKVENIKKTCKAEVLVLPSKGGKVDLEKLLKQLSQEGITSVLVEGGGEVHASMLEASLVDKMHIFIAPKIIGGQDALGPVRGSGAEKMSGALRLYDMSVEPFDEDIMLTAYLRKEHIDVYRSHK